MNRGAALQWSVILIGLGALGAACTWAVVRSPALAWRVELISRKAEGDIPELSWSELRTIVSPGGRFNLKDALSEGRSLEAALTNPYTSAQDVAQGGKIFRARCAVCHGSDAKGGRGPSLTDTRYRNGNSDLAIYCILRDGVQGTAMVPTNLSALERWEEIGYLRSLQRGAAGDSSPAGPNLHAVATDEDLRNAGLKPDQWLTYSGSYAGWRYTRSAQITPANVAGLKVRWVYQMSTSEMTVESTPLVVDGVIFTTEPPDDVLALDVRTGRKLWSYQHRLPSKLPLCCGRVNRGLAMTGSTLYLGTLDAHLVAVDAGSGDVKWDVEVADPAQGYSITGAPLAFGQMVVIGVSGGEFGARGLLAAYDTRNGRKLWQFDTVPSPGSPGSETWKSDAWRNGGGPTWMTGSYDPSAHLLYWGVGNPSPVYVGDLRPGDNLFTDSVLALQPETGKLVWHFQFSPHDEHDWDSNQTPVLADLPVKGTPRKLMLWANRNGFYYVLDRVTGEFLGATPFVRQNWAERIDARGRPVLSAAGRVSERGSLTYPGIGGGTNWQAVAFDPRLNYFLVQATEGSSVYTKSAPDLVRHVTGELYVGSGNESVSPVTAVVRALDAVSGEKVWEYLSPETRHLGSSGLLATEGGLVFGCSGGEMFAVDSHTGREGWRMFLGGRTVAAPISVDIDGRQTILVAAGRALFALGL